MQTTTDELSGENKRLRAAVTVLSIALLRQAAFDLAIHQPRETIDAQRLIREAEECARCAKLEGISDAIRDGLKAANRKLLAKAFETATSLQRAGKSKRPEH